MSVFEDTHGIAFNHLVRCLFDIGAGKNIKRGHIDAIAVDIASYGNYDDKYCDETSDSVTGYELNENFKCIFDDHIDLDYREALYLSLDKNYSSVCNLVPYLNVPSGYRTLPMRIECLLHLIYTKPDSFNLTSSIKAIGVKMASQGIQPTHAVEILKAYLTYCGKNGSDVPPPVHMETLNGIIEADSNREGTSVTNVTVDGKEVQYQTKQTNQSDSQSSQQDGETVMTKQTMLAVASTANKSAASTAARLTVGKAGNAVLIKAVKEQLPMGFKGKADHPLAKLLVANAACLAVNQVMPDNTKAVVVTQAMLDSAYLDVVNKFDIESMIEDMLGQVTGAKVDKLMDDTQEALAALNEDDK